MNARRMLPVFGMTSAACALLLSGCVVSQEFYLEDVHVSGPMNQPPVNITKDVKPGQITVSPHLSYNKDRLLKGKIPESEDGPSSMKDLSWTLPEYTFGVGVDYTAGAHVGVTAGWNFGVARGQGLWNGSLGLAVFGEGPVVGVRFDAGVQLRAMEHNSYVKVVTTTRGFFQSTVVDTGYFHDRGTDRALDFYGSLTLNTKVQDWPVNLFLNTALSRQSLLDYSPTTWSELHPFPGTELSTINVQSTATLLIFTPGVFIELGEDMRLLVGARIQFVLDMEETQPSAATSPFVQMEFSF